MTTEQRGPRVTDPVHWVVASYGVLLVLLLLVPSSAPTSWVLERCTELASDLGLPQTVAAPHRVESLLNVAAFVPVTLVGGLLRPSLTWRDWTAIGFLASLTVELVQAAALHDRTATSSDVVANTVGALLGALLAQALARGRG